jgi:hypothetical protein
MTRRATILLLATFAITRLVGGWLADNPDVYQGGVSPIGDPTLYRFWATQILEEGARPYTDIRIEYPPGSLPFIVAPQLVPGLSYRTALIGLMVALDILGLIAVWRIGRRQGSMMGPWAWTGLIPLLGPLAYLRLDLVPAVATLWALERATVRGWFGVGGWLGFGTLSKLYPVLLLPVAFVASSARRRLIGGAVLVGILGSIPFVATPRGLLQSVLGYHLERGIEIESVWGLILLVAARAGYPIQFSFDFESLNVVGSVSPMMELAAGALAVSAALGGTWLAARISPQDRERHLSAVMFATLTAVVAVATVLSPQYILWLIALGAAAACSPESPVRPAVLLLAPICLLTQAIYPFLFDRLAAGETLPITLLGMRNLLLLAAGLGSFLLITARLFGSGRQKGIHRSVEGRGAKE